MIQLGNAAGWLKHPGDVAGILKLPSDLVSFVTLGSYTLLPREGNPGNTFWDDGEQDPTSLNALGLPNPGAEEVRKFFPALARKIREAGKKVRVSIASMSIEDYKELGRIFVGLRPDEIEYNLGCPNVRHDGEQKPIWAFDIDAMATIIADAHRVGGSLGEPDISFKLSPYSDPFFLGRVADMLAKDLKGYMRLVTTNTFPNAAAFETDTGKPVIDPNDGYAGLGGYAMKHIALGQVRQLKKRLPHIALVGVGGVSAGADVFDLEYAGAFEAQVGTAFFLGGSRALYEIAQGYANLHLSE
jgi:dihydroorotate dehydrogenase (fumarate)